MVPVTIVDEIRTAIGYDVPALKEILGLRGDVPPELSGYALLEKYRIVFDGAKRAVLQIPEAKLDWVTPQEERRGQTLRVQAFHLFDRPDICIDAAMTGQYTFEMCHQYERLAKNYGTTRDIVEYADRIMNRLEDFLTNETHLLEKVVETYFGTKTVGQILNLTLSGIALRIKQMYHFLTTIGVMPLNPMRDEDFAGITVPKNLFGDG